MGKGLKKQKGENTMYLPRNLKYLRRTNGYSQDYIADLLGYKSYTTIQKWESGDSEPSVGKLDIIARLYKVSLDSLINEDLSRKEYCLNNAHYERNVELIPSVPTVNIPVYGTIPAGVPLEAIEDIIGHEDIPTDWLRGGKEYIGLKIKGDSMYPKYFEDDVVIIKLQPCCENRQDVAVYVNGYDVTLKNCHKNDDGSITLIPFNREYPPKTYSKGDDFKIIGKVVELRRKF